MIFTIPVALGYSPKATQFFLPADRVLCLSDILAAQNVIARLDDGKVCGGSE